MDRKAPAPSSSSQSARFSIHTWWTSLPETRVVEPTARGWQIFCYPLFFVFGNLKEDYQPMAVADLN